MNGCLLTASYGSALVRAGLIVLRCVDTEQPDPLFPDGDRVSVNHANFISGRSRGLSQFGKLLNFWLFGSHHALTNDHEDDGNA